MLGRQRIRSTLARILVALPVLLLASTGIAGAAGSAAASSAVLPHCQPAIAFDRGDFSNPTRIDNRFLPLVPGTRFTLQGTSNVDGVPTPHTVVLTVTNLTKVINGVKSRVLWDVDYEDGELMESELAFFAQDDDGNVWNTGEYPEEYEGGVFTGAPSTWIAGRAGALAGPHMLAEPRVGTRPYLQGRAPTIGFWDCGQVFQKGASVSVAGGRSYDRVLVINEWAPLDQAGGMQRKFYAPGVGVVQITAVDDPQGEILQLTKVERLSARKMAEARSGALELDARGCENSAVYCTTPPAQ